MIKKQLDSDIFLYKNNNAPNFLLNLENIESAAIDANVWEISSKSNIKDTDFTLNKQVFYLKSGTYRLEKIINNNNLEEIKYYYETCRLRGLVNSYAFNFIKDYVDSLELKIKGVKDWAMCLQKESNIFHNNLDRDGSKNRYTIVIGLNSDYIGGEFYFKDRLGNEPVRIEQGDVLIFPSSNQYQHKEEEVISGKKYCLVGYF